MRIIAVVGARPNFMKIAPIMRAIERREGIEAYLVHTGQHYDEKMSDLFFRELNIPRPDIDLGVGSGSHAAQTGEVMKRMEPIVAEQKPDALLVVGDVNSTVASALTAVKMGVPVAHVEAGLRSFDRTMPEEINRVVTDAISQWLFVSERSGIINLRREGICEDHIHFVGNVMIDTLLASRSTIEQSRILQTLELAEGGYGVVTLHRPANVDDPIILDKLMCTIEHLQERLPLVFPVHPRARKALESRTVGRRRNVRLSDPLGYHDFIKLVAHSRMVLTDSGGIQEETTVLGVPCLTLRNNTERPVTIEQGTNVLVGSDGVKIEAAFEKALSSSTTHGRIPELWDGHAADRIIDVLTSGAD